MSLRTDRRSKRRGKLLGLAATILVTCGLSGALAAPAAADRNQCAPAGVDTATVLPKDLTASGPTAQGNYTTATVSR